MFIALTFLSLGKSCQNEESCCTEEEPCGLLQGKCEHNGHCRDGLICGRRGCPNDQNCCHKPGISIF